MSNSTSRRVEKLEAQYRVSRRARGFLVFDDGPEHMERERARLRREHGFGGNDVLYIVRWEDSLP